MLAAANGHMDIVRLLLQRQARVDILDDVSVLFQVHGRLLNMVYLLVSEVIEYGIFTSQYNRMFAMCNCKNMI